MVVTLKAEATRNLARSLFAGFFERGIGANEALRQLKEQGLGYRRTDFLRDFREGLGNFKTESQIRYVGLDKVPSDRVFLERYHGLPDHYGYLYEFRVFDSDLGEEYSGYRWFFTDFRGTKREIMNFIHNDMVNRGNSVVENLEIKLEAAHINPYWEAF